jgi:sodium-dependent dicarboxylate transporter 2/3/5
MLILSYSASLGGLMTPIGTPPNLVFLGILKKLHGTEIDFVTWMMATVPVGICSLAALLLVIKYGPLRGHIRFSPALIKAIHHIGENKKNFLPEQKITLGIFGFVIFLWIFKTPLNQLMGVNIFDDQITAIIGSILLFALPFKNTHSGKFECVLQTSDINLLPWDVFLLFGGSMALAAGIEQVGILDLLMKKFELMASMPFWTAATILIIVTVILTEVMSNVALAAVALPLVIGWGKVENYSVESVGLMVTLATSFGFSLPMSTPPNAIVFGTGHVRFKHMLANGWIMNLLTTGILLFFALTWWKWIF